MTGSQFCDSDLINALPVGLMIWQLQDLTDADSFKLIAVNPVARQILDLPISYDFNADFDPFPGFLKIELPDVYAELVRSGGVRDLGEIRYRDRSKPEQVFAAKAFALSQQRVGVMFENISDRKQVEQELHNERARLSGILRIAKDAVISVDQNQRIQLFNQGAEAIFGYRAYEVLGQPLDLLLHTPIDQLHPHSNREASSPFVIDRSKELKDFHRELCGRRRDGTEFSAEVSISKLQFKGEDIFTVILRDITARKQAEALLQDKEQFLRSIYEGLEESVFVIDVLENGEFHYAGLNPAHERLTGILSEELQGKTPEQILPPSAACAVRQRYQECIIAGETISYEEYLPFNGVENWWSTRLTPLRNSRSRIYRLIGTSINVTDRKRLEEERKQFIAQLEQSNRELQDFAFVASHDLQEPLRKIQAFGDRLRLKCGDVLPADGLDYLARIQNAAKRMQTLIDDLLVFSRITTKAQPFVPTDLSAVVQEVLSDLEIRIQELGAQVKVGALPTLDADPMQMRQLLQNLISNALKFQQAGVSPVIQVHCQILDALEGSRAIEADLSFPQQIGFCQIRISDNGIGFDLKYLDRIFTVFQRLHGRNEYEGTGVGLAICRRIVERHSGSITAISAPGKGSTFIVTLPLQHTA